MQTPFLASTRQFVSRHRFMIGLMLAGGLQPIVTVMVRTGTSYRAVELGASVLIIGVITAAYSLFPILFGIKIGRYVDRGHDARVARIAAATAAVSCIGFAFSTHWIGLAAFSLIQGLGSMTLFLGMQVMCARDDSPGAIVRTFGNLMVAGAIGQGLGAGILALLGGSATIADAQPLFITGVIVAGCILACTFLIPPLDASERARYAKSDAPASIAEILAVPNFAIMLAISIVTVVSIDLMLVYLPLIGVDRHVSVDTIGAMLAVRSVTSLLARVSFAWLHRTFGANVLIVTSTLASALCLLVIALPSPIWALFTAVAASGFALGLAVTTALVTSMAMMTPDKRGTAASMRMVGNLSSQFAVPIILGFVAAATGVGVIFGFLAIALLASSVTGIMRKPAES